MNDENKDLQNDTEQSFSRIDSNKARDLEIPSGFDKNKVEDLKERKEQVIKKINEILSGEKTKKSSEKLVFSFYTPPQEPKREVGEKWVDSDGHEWEQHNGYKIRLPKISRDELIKDGYLMPFSCPKCKKPLTHPLDKKMWKFHRLCFDCVQEFETELRIQGKYKEYERQKIMANIRAFYNDVMNGLEDYVNSFDATFVNSFGEIERWDKADKELIKTMVLNDLNLLKESFKKEFGEPLEKGDVL